MSPILIITILFVSAFVSGIAVFFVKRDNTHLLKLVLSFSGAYLFSITVLHLIPEVYHTRSTHKHTIGLFVLAGFLLQLALEQLSHGIEHGHIHHDEKGSRIFPLGIMIGLCLHAILEGMPLAAGHQSALTFGIALHHIPAAFALGSLLLNTSLTKQRVLLSIALFAFMTPLGYLISSAISSGSVGNIEQYFDRIMAVVIGIFVHISTTILFESGSTDHHRFNKKKIVAVGLGIAVSLLNFAFHPHVH